MKRFKATWVVLLLLCLMYFITYVDRVNVSTAAEPIRKEFGLSNTLLGAAFSAFGYAYLALQVSGGWIADKFGPRKTLTVAGFIWAGATIATGLSGGLISLIVIRVVIGFGEGATFPTATRAMSNWTPPSQRGFAQGITHAFARIGNAVTPILVVWLISRVTWRGSFFAVGLVSMVWVLVWWFYFRDDPRDHPQITKAEVDALLAFKGARQMQAVPWGKLTARMAPVIITYFCYGWTLWLYLTWLPQFFLHGFKLDLKNSALFSSSVFVAGVIGDTLGGVVSDWILHKTGNLVRARTHLVCASMIGSLCCLAPVLYVHNLVVVACLLAGAFFFLEMTIGPIWAIPMDIAPAYSGTASGLMNSGSALAAILSPQIFGIIIDKTGNWTLPFAGSMALLVVGAVCSFFMHPERQLSV